MKIIIDNVEFPFDEGCRILKLKHKDSPFEDLNDFWDDIVPMKFVDVAKLENLEQRRIGINYLGIDEIVKQVNPIEVDRKAIFKTTTWINEKGVKEEIEFKDVYELYKVKEADLLGDDRRYWGDKYHHFVKFKDTSTDREYMIWVDLAEVNKVNGKSTFESSSNFYDDASAIDAIAWTITTNVPSGQIEKIVRQGDCILVKPKSSHYLNDLQPRHLKGEEYLELLKLES
jgi:hypothetical protein